MKKNIKELKGFEENYLIKIINSFYNSKNNNIQSLRAIFEHRIQEIRIIKNQIKMLKFESLDLNEEITRLLKEIEIKQLDERYR